MSAALEVSVRAATTDDLEFIAASHHLAHDAIADARGGELDTLLHGRQGASQDAWQGHSEAPGHALLIGQLDGLAVGYSAMERAALPDGRTLARITDLWVHNDARGVGVGAALMHELESIASSWGAMGLDSRALPGDRVTKNFFESFGLVARAIHVHRPL